MMCKMAKRGLAAAGLSLLTLGLLFGTSAPSYVKTLFYRVRSGAKDAVPVSFEIDRARQQLADLQPAIDQSIESLARAEEDVQELKDEIVAFQGNLAQDQKEMLALRESLDTGDYRLTGSVPYTPEEIKADLAGRFDSYLRSKEILKEKEKTLKLREQAVVAARQQLINIQAERRTLQTQIEEIEARHKAILASQSADDFSIDDGASSSLAQVKETIGDLNKRLNVQVRASELKGRFSEKRVPVTVQPTRDVVREFDSEFGFAPKATDKSL